MNKNYNQLVPT